MADTQEYPVTFICHRCDFRSRKLLDVELHGHRGYVEAVVVMTTNDLNITPTITANPIGWMGSESPR